MTIFSLAAVALAAASSKSTKTSGSPASLIFIVVIFAAVYFLFLRPRSQAAKRQRNTLMELTPGDEVLTGAGIFGRVLDVESDRVTIETAPGTRLTVLRSTIARRITGDVGPGNEEHDLDEDHDGWHDEDHDEDHDHGGDDHHDADDEHHDWGTKDDEDHDPDGAPSAGGTGQK